MSRTVRAAILLALLAPAGATRAAPDPAAEAWARAVAEHPTDPDVRLGQARHLEAVGDREDAAAAYRAFLERWPDRRPDLWLHVGRLLQALGRDAEALPYLRRAVEFESDPGPAHLHWGLSLRRLGRHVEAEVQFARAGQRAPDLAAEASLLGALSRIDRGDEAGAVPFLERAVEADPDGQAGRSARLLLRAGRGGPERPPWLHAELYGGYETDSNVTLDGSVDLPDVSEERSDGRAVWGAGITLRPLHTPRLGLTLGARYDQAEQEEISRYDTRRELAFASLRVSPHERLALRIDALATRTRLDHRRYQRTRSVQPGLFLGWGDRAGWTRAFARLEALSFPEEPVFASLERDGWAAGGGLEHYLPVPGWRRGWLSLGADFRRFDSDSGRDALGFASPYDHDRVRATVRIHGPLGLGLESEASLSFSRADYEHRNVIDALTDGGTGTLEPSTRLDHVLEGRVSLLRPISRFADVELRYQQVERTSNVDVYEYDRRILGVYVRVHTP
jgi:tetratricopeptide (TPR) repeat protein